MDPVYQALIDMFVGGELEVQNGMEGYGYRGKIATLEFTPANREGGAMLRVTFEWVVKATGEPHSHGVFFPTTGWQEDTDLDYACNTDLPSPEIGAPHLPNIRIEATVKGYRMVIFNPYTGEMTILFAKGGSRLDHDNVTWLPDGPKARADALRAREAGTSTPEA